MLNHLVCPEKMALKQKAYNKQNFPKKKNQVMLGKLPRSDMVHNNNNNNNNNK
jgi:hypothetical protein